jgi:hypothetical protein
VLFKIQFSKCLILFICSDKFGEFVVDMVVIVDKTVYDAKEDFEMTVEQALTEEVEDGKLGLLNVDPKSLELRAPGNNNKVLQVRVFRKF